MKLLALLLLLPSLAAAEPDIRTQNPQGYGWVLGDELTQRIHISLPDGVSIDPASLPKPRAVDYWLDLREVSVEPSRGGVWLTLRWQNFYAAIAPDEREVPGSPIRLSDGTTAELPGFNFVSSPLRPITAPTSPDQMQPEARFQLIDPRPSYVGLAASLCALTLSWAALALHQAWWPFRPRASRPFTAASRQIARSDDPAEKRRQLHRAFDKAFGRVLIGSDLARLLQQRPELRSIEDRLTRFFANSDEAFFGRSADTVDDLDGFARELSRIERGRA